ncbi:MAG: MFS transporter [Cyclobacteriaceae bacterium]|nr:MFS transporter [Cyclobacteriaceae bacterium]
MKNDKKVIWAWSMYDWANSVYSLVIISSIFPVYYENVTRHNDSDLVSFFGVEMINTVLYSYALSFSFLVVASILPLLTGIADFSGRRMFFMKAFVYMGSVSCMGLAFFTGENVELGIILSILASIAFSGSLVFYNSYLPQIATIDKMDSVSAKGFSYGYIGSVLLLIINLLMIQKPEWFGIARGGTAARISFVMVGLWWLGFSQITFRFMPADKHLAGYGSRMLLNGYREIRKVWNQLKELPVTRTFLLSFLFYNTGVQTVMYMAAQFGSKVLHLEGGELIMTILIINIIAIAGSYLFAKLSVFKGNKFSLSAMVIIWILVCAAAFLIQTKLQFFMLAFVVGMIMGGIQALSRATYSKLIPKDTTDLASFFSFYDVTYNVSIVIGTFAYGIIENMTGSMRNSSLTLALFFFIGLGFLLRLKMPHETPKETV